MKLNVRVKSIGVRWFLYFFLFVMIIVIAATVAASFLYSSLYSERVKTLASDYAYTFNSLKNSSTETFRDAAVEQATGFAYKDKVEVTVMDSEGKIFLSTTGFKPKNAYPDEFNKAIKSGGSFLFEGKNSDGERIMSETVILTDSSGEKLGAYCWAISLENVHLRTVYFVLSMSAIAVVILLFTGFSGLFFLRSIVGPIRTVGNAARKIAMGDFESRIEIEREDEIGELCDTINYMATELAHTESMKNDFISSVSHELRTPLTAIRGWGETAKMSLDSDPELVNRGLDVVLSEADRLSGLVEELLDFSRMQSGNLTVTTAPVNISALLKTASDMYTELAKKQGIELIFTVPKTEATVLGDSDRLKQVFINIIDNAVKYSEKGGLVLIDQTVEEGCVRISVKDTGVGIPAQDIDHVKEKFFKSNKTVRGSGIGLAVADEIIKQHKGLIFVESTEGVGTTVTVVLPIYEEPETKEIEETVPLESTNASIAIEEEPENENTEKTE